MKVATSVLMFGQDTRLLEIRARVLASAGHCVTLVATFADLQRALRSLPSDLLILCHSLPDAECEAALALDKTPTLVLHTGSSSCRASKAA